MNWQLTARAAVLICSTHSSPCLLMEGCTPPCCSLALPGEEEEDDETFEEVRVLVGSSGCSLTSTGKEDT